MAATAERSDRIRLPRLEIIHVMIISGVLVVPTPTVAARDGKLPVGCLQQRQQQPSGLRRTLPEVDVLDPG
jgi:hypothetical protein